MSEDSASEPGPPAAPPLIPAPGQPAEQPVERTAEPAAGAGEFERYALIAALTLVVLCLLIWDRWHGDPAAGPAPRPDRTLRVSIGGDAPQTQAAPGIKPPDPAPKIENDRPPAPPPPQRTYTVKGGDSLYDIAKRELGSPARAQEIADLNALPDASHLKVNQVLKLPAK